MVVVGLVLLAGCQSGGSVVGMSRADLGEEGSVRSSGRSRHFDGFGAVTSCGVKI